VSNNKTDSAEDISRQVLVAAQAAEDSLGSDTDVFFVGEILGITDWFVVTTGNNVRQVKAIVEKVEEALTIAEGRKPIRIEGKESAEWILMDYGDFIIHVFIDEARDYYELSRLWSDVPRMDIATPSS